VNDPPGLRALLEYLTQRERHDPHDEIVRLAVQLRANDRCEYCLLPTTGQFHVDHIVPTAVWNDYAAGRVRGVLPLSGRARPDNLSNFAWSCAFCNTRKGNRVTFRLQRRAHRLFDPRSDQWREHFIFLRSYLFIVGITDVGRATTQVLGFNDARLNGPLGTRHEAILAGHYPPGWARSWLAGTDK
jgi:5-methylcytosine-specific restriction endonuclease McrA